jgi:hypothetical protein
MHTTLATIFRAALVPFVFLAAATAVHGDDKATFNAQAAAKDSTLFRELDRNADRILTPDEARGDLDLGPRFDDIDINRDSVITGDEFKRYIEQQYGVTPESPFDFPKMKALRTNSQKQ